MQLCRRSCAFACATPGRPNAPTTRTAGAARNRRVARARAPGGYDPSIRRRRRGAGTIRAGVPGTRTYYLLEYESESESEILVLLVVHSVHIITT